MNITPQMVEEVLKTLPIGYYLGRRVPVVLDAASPTSFVNLPTSEIHVAVANVEAAVGKMKKPTPADIEAATRCALYHELSHVLLTPQTIFSRWVSGKNEKDWFNILEDARIEKILGNYYMGVNFPWFIRAITGGEKDASTARSLTQYIFCVVRYRKGPVALIAEWDALVAAHTETALAYPRDLALAYKEFIRRCKAARNAPQEEQQEQQEEQRPQESQDGEGDGNGEGTQSEDAESEENQSEESGGDKENEEAGDGENESGEDDAADEDGDDDGEGDESGDEDEAAEDGDEREEGGETEEGDESEDTDGESEEAVDDGEAENESCDDESGEGEESDETDGDDESGDDGDAGDEDGETSEESEQDGGEDGEAKHNDSPTGEAGGTPQDDEDGEDEDGDDDDERQDPTAFPPPSREQIAQTFEKILDPTGASAATEQALRHTIFRALRKAGATAGRAYGYTGKVDPRAVGRRGDYRWFAKSNGDDARKGTRLHLTLCVDCSGSFDEDVKYVNGMITALNKLEKSTPDFAFDVIRMGDGAVKWDKHIPLVANDCNCLDGSLATCVKAAARQGWRNMTVVVWDGAFHGGWYWYPNSSQPDAERDLAALNNRDTVIVSDTDNENHLAKFAPKARTQIISKDYATTFIGKVCELLDGAI